MWTDHTKWVRWRWRQIQNHAGTQRRVLAFEFFEKETWIQESFWSILSPFPSSLEKKGEERKIKANPASAPRIAGIFVFFESDQHYSDRHRQSVLFAAFLRLSKAKRKILFGKEIVGKYLTQIFYCFYLSSKVGKVEKVRKSHRTNNNSNCHSFVLIEVSWLRLKVCGKEKYEKFDSPFFIILKIYMTNNSIKFRKLPKICVNGY